jgi:HD-GYP domain-containing protein (c-di-GMP phosphodiesterase class II)
MGTGSEMRKVSIHVVSPGDVLARDIITDKGSALLRAGRSLSDFIIERLKLQGIDTVYIEDTLTEDIRPSETLNEETRLFTMRMVRQSMIQVANNVEIENMIAVPRLGKVFRDVFKRLLGALSKQDTMLIHLADLYVKEDYLYHQSINVAALSIIMGITKGYDEKQLEQLGIGALLADIGMVRIPGSTWDKDTPLSEDDWAQIRQHPEIGYQYLTEQEDIDPISALCARQHHERFDGQGYPHGLTGSAIHEYSQIIAIADVYSALTSTRKYRQRYSPSEAIEYLFAVGNSHFSLELLQSFTAQIAIYPVASTVRLNTGQTAVVTEVRPSLVTRPVVRIINETDGSPVFRLKEIDLSKHFNVTIVNVM